MRRPRNLYRRGGVYYARVYIGGELYRYSLKTRDPTRARARLPEALAKIRLQHRIDHGDPDVITVKTFAARWLTEWVTQRRNKKGVEKTEQYLRDWILPEIGAKDIASIGYAELRALRGTLDLAVPMSRRDDEQPDARLMPRSIYHILSDVRCLLRYAADVGEIGKSPWRRDILPRIPDEAPKALSVEQLALIRRYATDRERALVDFAVSTGLRWGELVRLQWRHVVDRPKTHLVLDGTKSGKVRRVPLSIEALAALKELKRQSSSVYVSFVQGKNPCNFPNRIAARMPETARVKWHWHQLRHTFACGYLERGGSLAALQKILGHSTSRMTERYAALSDAAVFADVERMELGTFVGHTEKTGR